MAGFESEPLAPSAWLPYKHQLSFHKPASACCTGNNRQSELACKHAWLGQGNEDMPLRLPCCAATGHTAAWVVYAVSQRPQVEAKIVEELRSLDLLATPEQPSPRPIQWENIPRLTYLNAVIKVRLPLCICACLHSPMPSVLTVSRMSLLGTHVRLLSQ